MKTKKGLRTLLDRRGFTLVELMVAALVFSLVVLFGMRFLILQQSWAAAQEDAVETQQEVRAAVDFMVQELGLLGFGLPPDETGMIKAGPDEVEFLANLHHLVTILTEAAGSGRRELSVAAASGFKQGRRISVCSRDRCEWHTLAADGNRNRIELENGLGEDFPINSTVHLINRVGYAVKPNEAGSFQLFRNVDGGVQSLADRLVRAGFEYLDREGRPVDDPERVDRVRVRLSARPKRAPGPVRSFEAEIYLRNGGGGHAMP